VTTAANTGPSSIDLAAADKLLTTTRSVRKRLDLEREVPLELVMDCIRIAQQAPTGSNSQQWRWIVVTDPAKRAAIAEAYREGAGNYFAGARPGTETQTGRVVDSATYLLDVLDRVPVHVIPCHVGRPDGLAHAHAAGIYGSVLPAAWSFMLAGRARGLGSAWTTLHLNREKQVAELLGIPDDVAQMALIPVAYYTGEDFRPAERPPVESIVHVDSWD
jgi:nitroreductase